MDWLSYAVAAMVLLGLMNFGIKLFVGSYQPLFALLLVQAVSTLALLAIVLYNGGFSPDSRMLKYAVPTGLAAALGLYFSFTALRMDSASKVIPIVNLNTIVVVLLAVAFLNEKLGLKAALGIAFGILSIVLLSL